MGKEGEGKRAAEACDVELCAWTHDVIARSNFPQILHPSKFTLQYGADAQPAHSSELPEINTVIMPGN